MTPFALHIASLHAAYAEGRRPADVVREVLRAIAAADDPGIFIALREEASLVAEAESLPPFDRERYPLWGIPFAVKDNIDAAGIPTTAACPAFAYSPEEDATCVARLRAAGALLVGKTNLDQFATGLVGVRTPYPVPRNAIDPALVPGGSSSGSAVAVAAGLVSFALGTDTAGSGRVPAGLNNIVGLKPSLGAVPTRGVVPACRGLDCVSVFAGTIDDAWAVFAAMAGQDDRDALSRPVELGRPGQMPERPIIAVPRAADLRFFGDEAAATAWAEHLAALEGLGARLAEIDMSLFFEAAALLYEGPWVAERWAAVGAFIAARPDAVHPVTRRIIEGGRDRSAADLFAAQYRLREIARATAPVWTRAEALAVPTAPLAPTRADLEADPILPNSRLGTYTNFVNLLDLSAIAVPGTFRTDRRAAGVTLIGPRGADARLAAIARAFHLASRVTIGATPWPVPAGAPVAALPPGWIEIVVVGAHMSGMALNHELTSGGGIFRRAVRTLPEYRLHALPGGPPHRPGLVRVGPEAGAAIAVEVWALPTEAFGRFVAKVPAPLSIGTLALADGTRPKGFLCETAGLSGARDITAFGGWRAFVEAVVAEPAA